MVLGPQATSHEAGEHRHHHLRLDFHQVLGERIHPGANLPGHGDGVPKDTVIVGLNSCCWRCRDISELLSDKKL